MRNLKFIATAAVIFIIISCADLDLSPLSEGSSNNWYHDDTEYLMSLNDLMRAEFYPIDSYPWDDDVFSRNSQEETKNGNMTSESGTAKSRWLILYKAIARSLRILNNLQTAETTTDIAPANIRQYKGEAYFHLGFSYAMLATYYGDVILDKKECPWQRLIPHLVHLSVKFLIMLMNALILLLNCCRILILVNLGQRLELL